MEKEKRTSAFLLWILKAIGLFVTSADGTGYVINPKFIQIWTYVNNSVSIPAEGVGPCPNCTVPTPFTYPAFVFPQAAFNTTPNMSLTFNAFQLAAGVSSTTLYARNNSGTVVTNANAIIIAISPGFLFKRVFGGGLLRTIPASLRPDWGWTV